MTARPDDVEDLRRLEESLWRSETRNDRSHLEEVLAPDFVEFGRSGEIWSREEILDGPGQELDARLPLPGFTVRMVGPDAALVTYRSEFVSGNPLRANRSSLWNRMDGEWRLVFHQGTPALESTS
jgi:hypothetical protein